MDEAITVWAPINSWEPHILYRRASLNLDTSTLYTPSMILPPICCIVIDSSVLTKVLETMFNQSNGKPVRDADLQQKISDIARRGPDLCLVLNQRGNELDIWCIDVSLILNFV
jgi:hypothetical protein